MKVSGKLHTLAALSLEKQPGTQRTAGWVGPTADLDMVTNKKNPFPAPAKNQIWSSSL